MILLPILVFAYVLLYAFALQLFPQWSLSRYRSKHQQQISHSDEALDLESWLEREEVIALEKLFSNIAPKGSNAREAVRGTVIASPSREHPNYYYQWVRDAAIAMSTVVDVYKNTASSNLSDIIAAYASLQYDIQHSTNPSGTLLDPAGLGEPKFHVDGSPFTEDWGRPQRDGPALRALALMAFLKAYNNTHPDAWTETGRKRLSLLYDPSLPPHSLIKADLEYISHYWNREGFDLWEEVNGIHFFTSMVQLRALREGIDIATAFGDHGAANWYKKQAAELVKVVSRFRSPGGQLSAIMNTDRSGLDCSLLLASLHASFRSSSSFEMPFAPQSDAILLSLLSFTQDQALRHPINGRNPHSNSSFFGTGLGRYPEDIYDGYGMTTNGGNPWFLCTSSAAEILYRAASYLMSKQVLFVSEIGVPFWSALLSPADMYPALKINMRYDGSSEIFKTATNRLKEVGDEFLQVVKFHADADGSLSEQFDRVTGYERGALDLTWSYGAFLQACWARKSLLKTDLMQA